jgi:ADP-heptose:LPS heptosyltransferase
LLQRTKYKVVPYTRGKGLDLGRGPWKAFPHFIGVREKADKDMPEGMTPDFAVDSFETMSDFIEGSLDFVYQWGEVDVSDAAVETLLRDGGYFVRTTWVDAEAKTVAIQVRQWRDGVWENVDPRPCATDQKTVCVTRYGAIGDMLQTAFVVKQLKADGYHVTLNSHPEGELLLRHDPNVDAFMVQDRDQVPNQELLTYWKDIAERFDKHVNLCETVEGTFLAHPGRALYRFPHAVRHSLCNRNYLQFMADVAEIEFHPEYTFFPSEEENQKAGDFVNKVRQRMNKDTPPLHRSKEPYMVFWALAGSSVHKTYPHMDAVIARMLLEIPNAHIILNGDETCRILEQGWESEERISCLSGKMDIRDSITLAKHCQLVVGPETGVLNAVAFDSMAKVLMLSHSSEENLSRDWTNTESLHSTTTKCYPCHQLHYDRSACPQHEETNTALCQYELPPSIVWEAISRAHAGWNTIRSLLQP